MIQDITQQEQAQSPMLDQDTSRAGLAVITYLMTHLLPQAKMQSQAQPNEELKQQEAEKPQEKPQEQPKQPIQPQQETPAEPESPQEDKTEPQEEDKVGNLAKDFEQFKGKMEGIIETKFDTLAKTITDALKD